MPPHAAARAARALMLILTAAAVHAAPPPAPVAPWPLGPSRPSPLAPVAPADIAPPAPATIPQLPAPMIGPLRDRLQERLDAHREAAGAPGACLAVILPGGQEFDVASGLSRRGDPDSPITTGDRMPSGSVGKTYVAAVAMLLVQDGLLDLDAPITAYLTDHPWLDRLPGHATITPRMLLNHTAGLREHVTSPAFTAALQADPDTHWTLEDVIAFALDTEPLFEPGTGWSYADTNYILLGIVVEAVTGQPYNDLLRDRLLTPLGLVWTDPTEQAELWGLIPGYTSPDNPFGFPEQTAENETYCINPQFETTGGGTITTTPDLARWGDHLYGGRVLAPESLAAMTAGVPSTLGENVTYGLGTIIWPSPHGPVWGHSGWFPGYVSVLCHYPDLGITIAYQQNTDVRASTPAIRRLMDGVAGLVASTLERVPANLRPPPQTPDETPDETLAPTTPAVLPEFRAGTPATPG